MSQAKIGSAQLIMAGAKCSEQKINMDAEDRPPPLRQNGKAKIDMTSTDTEKVEMNTNTNQRLVAILLILLIVFVGLLTIGIIAGWLWMGGMMGWGGTMTNDMANACIDMMRNIQAPQ